MEVADLRAPRENLDVNNDRDLLRFLTCGSVDDGKSTLIGRLLYDIGQIPEDQLAGLNRDSRRMGTRGSALDFALLVDGLEAERQQGITIDIAYRYFRTPSRVFIIADAPGHEQYTRNMATAASTADLAIILVDARKGVLKQTKRHTRICDLLGIKRIILAVNKLDLMDFSEGVFREIVGDYHKFAGALSFQSIDPIPLVAVDGDNVVERSTRMPWYDGPTLLAHLELSEADKPDDRPFRFPIQWVARPNLDFRGFAGTIVSGTVRVGDEVLSLPAGKRSFVRSIEQMDGALRQASAGEAVVLTLTDEVDLARGDVLCAIDQPASVADQVAATIVWMSEHPMLPGRSYLMRIGTQEVPASITSIRYQVDVDSGEHLARRELALNDIGVCHLSTMAPIVLEPYESSREMGGFILIDRSSNDTVGAGLIHFALRRSENVHAQEVTVEKQARAQLKGQKPTILWFTGLSGAGKSTLANRVEQLLHQRGVHTYLLDGDNVRLGINRDLGFTDADRVENIRRVGEIARLFVDAGVIVLCAFISPFAAERDAIRALVHEGEFVEIFVDAPLGVCVQRDPKGLYSKARAGKIENFTGVTSPYEPPAKPELRLLTADRPAEALAQETVAWLKQNGFVG